MRRLRSVLLLVLAPVALSTVARPAPAGQGPSSWADFSGTWQLQTDPEAAPGAAGDAAGRQTSPGRGGRGQGDGAAAPAVAFESMQDDRRITIVDDGFKVRISAGAGAQRVLYTDGDERELDDADGIAKVVAKRKGSRGERIVVTTRWHSGRQRSEAWELRSDPRRLVGSVKVTDRTPYSYERVYVPAPAAAPAPRPPAAEVPPASQPAVPAEAEGTQPPAGSALLSEEWSDTRPVPTPAAARAGEPPPARGDRAPMKTCTTRPARGTADAALAKLAKLSPREAEAKVSAAIAPRQSSGIISAEPEVREGCLVYTFFARFPGGKEPEEFVVDAGDGRLLAPERD